MLEPATETLTIPQAARALDVHEVTIRRMVRSGRLRAYRLERAYRIPRSAVEELQIRTPSPRRDP